MNNLVKGVFAFCIQVISLLISNDFLTFFPSSPTLSKFFDSRLDDFILLPNATIFQRKKKEIAAEKREKKKKPQEKLRIIPRNLSPLKIIFIYIYIYIYIYMI